MLRRGGKSHGKGGNQMLKMRGPKSYVKGEGVSHMVMG